MKHVMIHESIRDDPGLAERVVTATGLLEGELGHSSNLVAADWRLDRNRGGRDRIVLSLSDETGTVAEEFEPAELSDVERMRRRINHLWGDLLQVRSHKLLEALDSNRSIDGQDAWDEIVDSVYDFSERHGVEPKQLKLPIRYAAALMKLGPSHWGNFFQEILRSGIRAFEGLNLLGMRVELVPGVDAKLEVA